MNWFIGFGVILIIYTVASLSSAYHGTRETTRIINRVYWAVVGIWDICFGCFFLNNISAWYVIIGLIFIGLSIGLLVYDCIRLNSSLNLHKRFK